jgi:sporulation protein YlmC with PRC-barrel domain
MASGKLWRVMFCSHRSRSRLGAVHELSRISARPPESNYECPRCGARLLQTRVLDVVKRSFPAALAVSLLLSLPVFAQTGKFITQEKADQWRASKLVGVNVYNQNNDKIGDISEVIVDKGGKADAVVIGVGGFLGIGQKDIAVSFNDLKWSDQPVADKNAKAPDNSNRSAASNRSRTYPDHAILNLGRDELKNAPDFKYAQ